MIYASILAAGLGIRMHRHDMPKQFLPLGKKPIIIHTLEQFFLNSSVGKIVIVAPTDLVPYTEDLIVQHNLTGKEYAVISGGVNKTVSISMSAKFIMETWGVDSNDILIAHDAIRPFVTQRIIDDNISAAQEHGAANTAFLGNDATLLSTDGSFIEAIPPYGQMFSEQTPQSYSIPKLMNVLKRAELSGISLSDEAELTRLWINSGEKLFLVRGEYFNMKISNPYDLEVANALLREQKV